jgi:hypothetical protein
MFKGETRGLQYCGDTRGLQVSCVSVCLAEGWCVKHRQESSFFRAMASDMTVYGFLTYVPAPSS